MELRGKGLGFLLVCGRNARSGVLIFFLSKTYKKLHDTKVPAERKLYKAIYSPNKKALQGVLGCSEQDGNW